MAQKTATPYLAIETSSPRLSLALGDDQTIRGVLRSPHEWRHAETLFGALESLCRKAGCRPRDLAGVAVSTGPGSFTGIRIGLAMARTLGQALRIPVVGISSLEVMAFGAAEVSTRTKNSNGFLAPEIDALSGKIFAAVYEALPGSRLRKRIPETHTTAEDWRRLCKARRLGEPQRVTNPPDAVALLMLARPKFRAAGPDSYRRVLPLYLRRPAAQERLARK